MKNDRRRMIGLQFAFIVVTLASAALLIACPMPMGLDMVLQAKDKLAPTISIVSPEDGSSYSSTVIVNGVISDATTANGDKGAIATVNYEVLATSLTGPIGVDIDGKFTFQFPTAGLSGSLSIRVTAKDKNGNTGSATISLIDAGAIPSFQVVPGNHEVTLKWNAVPLAESYDIFYTTDGSIPSATYYGSALLDVASPQVLSGLTNGNMHVFLLRARSSNGEEDWSGIVRAIPLSSGTLAPRLFPEGKAIRLKWPQIAATSDFEVWRSSDRAGPYSLIAAPRSMNEYLDARATDGAGYFYKVRPALEGSLFSAPSHGAASPFNGGRIVRTVATSASAQSVSVSGARAYVSVFNQGVQVLDVSNPTSASVVQWFPAPENNYANVVTAAGNYLFMTYADIVDGSTGGVRIIDMTLPSSSAVVRDVSTAKGARDVAIQGNYAFAAAHSGGLQVIDFSTPQTASVVKTVTTSSGYAYSIKISGNYAYVTNGADLDIVKISPIASAAVVRTVKVGNAWDIALSDGYAYVTNGASGLCVIDISIPESAVLRGTAPTTANASRVSVAGSRAYVTEGTNGVEIIDVSNPVSPAVAVPVMSIGGSASDVAIDGEFVYVSLVAGFLSILDTNAPIEAEVVGSDPGYTYANFVKTSEDYAFVTDWDTLEVVDVSDPAHPHSIRTVSIPGLSYGIALSGDYVYVASQAGTVYIVDVSSPMEATLVKTLYTPGESKGIDVFGDYAYVGMGVGGLLAVDISDPTAPSVLGTALTIGAAEDVFVSGHYAFVVEGYSGLEVFDVSNPRSPVSVGTLATGNVTRGVAVADDYVYVADGTTGLKFADASDPSSLGSPQTVNTDGDAHAVSVAGGYAVVADWTAGLQIVDLSSPVASAIARTVPVDYGAGDVAVSGRYAYVTDGSAGLKVVDLLYGQ